MTTDEPRRYVLAVSRVGSTFIKGPFDSDEDQVNITVKLNADLNGDDDNIWNVLYLDVYDDEVLVGMLGPEYIRQIVRGEEQ